VDEAGQATEAKTIISIQKNPDKVVLVGDVRQLPATVISQEAEEANFGLSMMDRLTQCGWPSVMLDTQYRMHPGICAWPSDTFYEGELRTPAAIAARTLQAAAHSAILQRPRAFYNINSQEKSRGTSFQNITEARTVVKLVQHILKADSNARQAASQAGAAAGEAAPIRTIGIITFYAPQVELITQSFGGRLPRGVRVSSVDGFQGAECDVIILSCVRNNKQGNIGFLQDPRRLNVAVTRPKHCLIVVGHATTLCKRESHLKQMITDMRTHNQVFSEKSLQNILDPKPPQPKQKPKKSKGKQAQSGVGGSKASAKSKRQPQRRKQKPSGKPTASTAVVSQQKGNKTQPQRRKQKAKAAAGGAASARLGQKQRQQQRRKQQPKKAAAKGAKTQQQPK
jgi:senataxin